MNSIFDYTYDYYQIKKPIRLIKLFAGIGSQVMALRDLGKKFEHYRVVESDKYAIASYNAIHNTNFLVMDITKIGGSDLGVRDTNKFDYIMIYSFPCQDISLVGEQKGMKEGSGTRGSLLWELKRLLNECTELPQILLMENVSQVHSDWNKLNFRKWLSFLESKGYKNFYKDLNAKDFNIPQNRKRCFMISIHGNYNYEFPHEVKLTKSPVSFLGNEDLVDEMYYFKSDKARQIIKETKDIPPKEYRGFIDLTSSGSRKLQIASCITSRYNAGIPKHKMEHCGVLISDMNKRGGI